MGWCITSAPQTRQDETRSTEVTTGMGKSKRQRGKAKGGHLMQQTPWMQPGREEKEIGDLKAGRHTTTHSEGEGTAGDEPGYTPTPEYLRLWEVYRDWVHANPVTHIDVSIRDDSVWQAW